MHGNTVCPMRVNRRHGRSPQSTLKRGRQLSWEPAFLSQTGGISWLVDERVGRRRARGKRHRVARGGALGTDAGKEQVSESSSPENKRTGEFLVFKNKDFVHFGLPLAQTSQHLSPNRITSVCVCLHMPTRDGHRQFRLF